MFKFFDLTRKSKHFIVSEDDERQKKGHNIVESIHLSPHSQSKIKLENVCIP